MERLFVLVTPEEVTDINIALIMDIRENVPSNSKLSLHLMEYALIYMTLRCVIVMTCFITPNLTSSSFCASYCTYEVEIRSVW